MTSLDPSHLPGLERTSNPTTGQAVINNVSPLHQHSSSSSTTTTTEGEEKESTGPSWRGAWKRRQQAKQQQQALQETVDDDDDDDEEEEERRGPQKIPIPPIPDLRYEQGILASLRPFLHSTSNNNTHSTEGGQEDGSRMRLETNEHELKMAFVEKTSLATPQLTAEGGGEGGNSSATLTKTNQSDVLMGGLRVEWGNVVYVLVRDQVVFPLLQGILWGMAGIYLNGLWEWNKRRLDIKNGLSSSSGGGSRGSGGLKGRGGSSGGKGFAAKLGLTG